VLPGSFPELLYRPWTLITNLFGHGDLGHFAFNMIMLYMTAKIFVPFFGERRLLTTYLLGGIFGALLHMVSYLIFPIFDGVTAAPIIGASGAIAALIGALVYYKPTLKIKLFFAIEIPFWVFGLLFIISDIMALTSEDGIAHFAHLGGAFFGMISVINVSKSTNFMNRFDALFSKDFSFKRQPKMKVYRNSEARQMTDDKYNANKANKQKQMDAILDKISANGYESLSKKEKDFLFKFSNE
jgi:membrane associated rhomboid family serine protease